MPPILDGMLSAPPPQTRDFTDFSAIRSSIHANVLDALKTSYPIENTRHRLELVNPRFDKIEPYTLDDQKQAILKGQSLTHQIKGTWQLVDKATGNVLDKKDSTIAHVPYCTDRGTFIHNGSEYTIANQMRLKPGVFTRVKDNGILESHVNVKPGTGPSFRVYMEPDTGIFRLGLGQSTLKLYPILRAMGVDDSAMAKHWGNELLQKNIEAEDPRAVSRAFHRLINTRALAGMAAPEDAQKIASFDAVERIRLSAAQALGLEKLAAHSDRRWTYLWFWGKLKHSQHKGEDWVLMEVHKGLCESAFHSLKHEGADCEARYDEPHISVLRPEECEQLKKKYGQAWHGAAKLGQKMRFRLVRMVNLIPQGWKDMDRVWFLECESPDLREYRKSLGFTELPMTHDGEREMRFHVTVAVKKSDVRKAAEFFGPQRAELEFSESRLGIQKWAAVDSEHGKPLLETFSKMELDPSVTKATLGHPFPNASPDMLLRVTNKLLNVSKGKEEIDDRDSLSYQTLHGPEDFFAERIRKDAGQIGKRLLWKSTLKGNLQHMPSGALTSQLYGVLLKSGMGSAIEETNPLDILDQNTRVLRLGEGAIGSLEAVPPEARNVQPSHLGFIDPIRAPECYDDHTQVETEHGWKLWQDVTLSDKLAAMKGGRRVFIYPRKLIKEPFKGNMVYCHDDMGFDLAVTENHRVWLRYTGAAYRFTTAWNLHNDKQQGFTVLTDPNFMLCGDEHTVVNPVWSRKPYDGYVYCATVDNHLLHVRRKGMSFWCGNSEKMGVDARVSHGVRKGMDNQIYTPMINARTGKTELVSAVTAANSVIAFPGEMDRKDGVVRAMVKAHQIEYKSAKDVDYVLPTASRMFCAGSNLVPMIGGIKGGRLLMGAKVYTQALPLKHAEAPLVQSLAENGKSFHELYGAHVGAVRAKTGGTVTGIDKNGIVVKGKDGEVKHELYDSFPFNRKSVCGITKITVLTKTGLWRGPIASYRFAAGDLVLCADPVTKRSAWLEVTAYLKHRNDKRLLRVRFASGRSVVVTEDHSLITLDAAGQLAPVYPKDCVIGLTRSPVVLLSDIEEAPNEKLTRELGVISGLYLSEGHIAGPANSILQIAVTPDGRAKNIMDLVSSAGYRCRRPAKPQRAVIVYGKELCAFLKEKFGHIAVNKRIPTEFLSAPRAFKEGLIAGYMAGDGCLWGDTNGAIQVTAVSVSKQLRDDLVDLLSSMGIFCSLFDAPRAHLNKAWHDGFGFRVISSQLSRLNRWFFYDERQKKFDDLLADSYRASPFEAVPVVGRAARKNLYAEINGKPPQFVYKTASLGFVAKHRLKDYSGNFGAWGRSDVMWDLIVGMDEVPHEDFVYDLSVAGAENFAVDAGLIVHNTYTHNTPTVKLGDVVEPGQLLAKSNYTDDKGTLALGTNLRTAYLPYNGLNHEDAIVISEGAAKRLASEHMYQHVFTKEDTHDISRPNFVSVFPLKYTKDQLNAIDKEGVVKPGTIVKHGDPLVLALNKSEFSAVHRGHKPMFSDASMTWEHETPGEVTDVAKAKDGSWNIAVRTYVPMQEGDKLTGVYGDKGVISKIVPDDQMVHDKDGKPYEMLLNPQGITSRANPSQVFEGLLGKIARKTGQAYKVPSHLPAGETWVDMVEQELKKHGVSDTEDLYDPRTGRKIPGVLTGERFMLKLHHTAEAKAKGRDIGAYTSEGIPAKGGDEGAKRIAQMEVFNLLSHGATDVLRDAKVIRGQRNDDYWRAFKLGQTPPPPKVPMIYEKFLAYLRGAGINVQKKGNKLQLFALTDKDIESMSAGEIKNPKTVENDDLMEIEGGLFDRSLTGGHGGNRWSHINLAEPIPNPIMEEPIRRLLGLTQKRFEAVLAGTEQLDGMSGGLAIKNALKKINVDDMIARATDTFHNGSVSNRDLAVKQLGYLQTIKKHGIKPEDFVLTKAPVLPPSYRPITRFQGMLMTANPNLLYRDMIQANQDLKEMKGSVGETQLGTERLNLYNSFKAVTGLGDPVQSKTMEKGVTGLIKYILGPSPKLGAFQRRVVGMPVDIVGRATISPTPDLDMDHVGIPEGKAWTIYRPFIVRRLIRSGMPAMQAAKAVIDQTPVARKAMEEELKARPVLINRAPSLHRYNFMAAWPVLTKEKTLQVPLPVLKGFNADFDGDNMNYHVPVSDEAVKDAVQRMLPSHNLKAVKNFRVHYTPQQELLMGLYLSSTANNNKPAKVFHTAQDAMNAYWRGEAGLGDKVSIHA